MKMDWIGLSNLGKAKHWEQYENDLPTNKGGHVLY